MVRASKGIHVLLVTFFGVLFLTGLPARATNELVAAGSIWKYLDNGADPGSGWRQPGFDDGAWASGRGQLGYGDGDEATVVRYGPNATNKYITTWFRRTFNVAGPSQVPGLKLQVLRDDGAVVYLNGTEVWRSNMPTGTIGAATRALDSLGLPEENQFFESSVSPSLLVTGTNLLAVEVHQSDPASSDLSFDLRLLSSDVPVVTRRPYLQQATPTSLIMRWRTDFPSDSRVRYGTNAAQLSFSALDAATTGEHEVRISGLQPGGTYYYQVGCSGGWFARDDRDLFIAPPPVGESRATRIWAIGDSGTASTMAADVRDAYRNYTSPRATDLWLMLGDNAYDRGTDAEYQAAVFDMYPTLLQNTVLWPAVGNHDFGESVAPPPDQPYFQIFSLPQQGEAGGVASGTEKYYSFDYGNIHFVCLDSQSSYRGTDGPMASWLRNDLTSTRREWVIAYWHHPPYTKGSHDSDTEPFQIEMRANIVPILEAEGVDLVLSGHSHVYERSYLLQGHYGLSSTLTEAMKKDGGDGRESGQGAYHKPAGVSGGNGAVYVVAGCSGLNEGGLLNHPAICASDTAPGSVVLDLVSNRLDATFIRADGTLGDHFTLIKDGPPLAKPAAPGNFTATTVSDSAITLAWQDNATNENAFVVERSADGLSFAEVVVVGANITNGLDASCSPDRTYFYRVRARNSAGSSSYSAVAQATTAAASGLSPLVPSGAVWRYRDDGSDQGTAWRQPGFDDSAWSSGPAQLGYGENDEATVVSYGPAATNKYITTWFRRSFNVNDASSFGSLVVELMRDDGAIVYLNGVELLRSNMPGGTVNYRTLVTTSVDGADESKYFVTTNSAAGLVNGTNVLAVEVHQAGVASSDLSFDLRLTGIQPPPVLPPAAPTALTATAISGSQISLAWIDSADNEAGFCIERSTNGGAFVLVGTAGSNATTFVDSGLQAFTTYSYRLRAYNAGGNSAYAGTATATTLDTIPLVAAGSVWKYRDDGSDQGAAWRQPGFDDSSWSSGAAQLGYGDEDEATVVSYGPDATNKYVTTWFRRSFNVSNASAISNLLVALMRDDGAVVYLNGTELLRNNMPGGLIDYRTLVTTSVDGANESKYFITTNSSAGLSNGLNVLAVEVHQAGVASSDLSFDLQVEGFRGPLPNAPAAPSALMATAVSGSRINLGWIDNADNEDGFRIERSTNGSVFAVIGTATNNATGYADAALRSDTTYSYRILAFNAGGNSAYSATASATTPDVTPPAAVANLAMIVVDRTSVDLSWSAPGDDGQTGTASVYDLRYSSEPITADTWESAMPASGEPAPAVAGSVQSMTVSNLIPGMTFYFVLRTIDEAGNISPLSNLASATTVPDPPPPPPAPAGLMATAISSARIDLSWVDNAANEDGFRIERSTNGASFALLASVSSNVTGYADPGVISDTTYSYRILAFNSGGNSAYSATASATTPDVTPPGAVANLAVTLVGRTNVVLSWSAPGDDGQSGMASLYDIRYASAPITSNTWAAAVQVSGEPAPAVAGTVQSMTIGALSAGTTYYFALKAFDEAGNASPLSVASATTLSVPTTTVVVYSVASEDGYIIESTETSNLGGSSSSTATGTAALRAGDTGSDQQYKAMLSFNTKAVLPTNATIVSATLRLKRGTVAGTNPFQTHGICYADIKGGTGFGGSTALANADFQAAADAVRAVSLSNAATNGAWSAGTLSAAGLSFINRSGTTQFRVYFALDDNDDRNQDYIGWYSGESVLTNRPRLEIVVK